MSRVVIRDNLGILRYCYVCKAMACHWCTTGAPLHSPIDTVLSTMPNSERTPLYTPHRERHRVYLTVTSTKQNKDDGIHDFLLRKRVFLCLEREKTPKCSACGRNLPPAAPAASRSTATGDPTLDTHTCRLQGGRAGPESAPLHACNVRCVARHSAPSEPSPSTHPPLLVRAGAPAMAALTAAAHKGHLVSIRWLHKLVGHYTQTSWPRKIRRSRG